MVKDFPDIFPEELSKYEGNIECASKSILLTTPEGRRIKYVSRHVPKRTQVNSLSGVV